MPYELLHVACASDRAAYHALRNGVLWLARGRSGYDAHHPDEHRPGNHPLLLKLDGRPIGTTRLDEFGNGTGAIRLVTVAVDLQRRGHGRVLSALVADEARRLGLAALFINAAPDAIGFYEKLGWEPFVWHDPGGAAPDAVQMRRSLIVA